MGYEERNAWIGLVVGVATLVGYLALLVARLTAGPAKALGLAAGTLRARRAPRLRPGGCSLHPRFILSRGLFPTRDVTDRHRPSPDTHLNSVLTFHSPRGFGLCRRGLNSSRPPAAVVVLLDPCRFCRLIVARFFPPHFFRLYCSCACTSHPTLSYAAWLSPFFFASVV